MYLDSSSESDDEKPKKKKQKKVRKSQDQRISEIVERLSAAHEDKWSRADYRLWATALVSMPPPKHCFLAVENERERLKTTLN